MTPNTPSILVADDDANVLIALKMLIKSEGFEVTTVEKPFDVLQLLKRKDFACVLMDLNYHRDTTSGHEGFELLTAIRELDEQVPVIVMTGFSSIDIAVASMQLGAVDFIQKPWKNNDLITKVNAQIKLSTLTRQGQRLTQENALLKQESQLPKSQIISQSSAMQSIINQLERLALSDMNIIFTGENGTGKSMLANYLHQCSARAQQAFLSVNMGAISENLFESEMFGHIKGAFTDSKETRIGRFEMADNGTIFLDEIANIPLSQQAKLLRVLEERQFEKVGSSKTQKINVRLVSATNADLPSLIEQGQFRQDLLYRLNTAEIRIPALRDRTADILPLAHYFQTQFCEKYRLSCKPFSKGAIKALHSYHWPGNIRELSHIIERALFLAQHDEIQVSDLGLATQDKPEAFAFDEATLDDIESHVIKKRLALFDNKAHETALSLGLSRSAYYRRLDKYKLLYDEN
ncbi:sigma-54-dependent transcriptional regulator [Pseudoalteromonas porphyrae]|uniref:Chemotaxis protein CheY n=1 Tax=Pseudoalteromonas porphyrae TaxID=187330 RepID=A0A0N1EKH0_9GAMM|nr:sigma-54 dependent transcriptional regulator [Pseudoalteromonas porphyrae]KPH63790.1 chemotaxis protein CheY [Pseudoalteromonas porphyrae]